MSPVTGLAWFNTGSNFVVCHMGNISPVYQDETKLVEHKLVSFAAVIALWSLWTPVTLLIKLIRIFLKRKYIKDINYAILAAMLRKRSYFV